jgi:hypothetical protein
MQAIRCCKANWRVTGHLPARTNRVEFLAGGTERAYGGQSYAELAALRDLKPRRKDGKLFS